MQFHVFGNKQSKPIVLIHGMLTPWQIWKDAVDYFSKDYCVIVPELDAHTEEEASIFQSIEHEADQIREYIIENDYGKIFMVCGLSMGGRIAAVLAGLPDISIENLVLDGAPLIPMPKIVAGIMKGSYTGIIRKSKKRDSKVLASFKKDFLPEKYLQDYLKIADNMEESSIKNIVDSVFSRFDYKKYDNNCRILFMHGTKGNELVSQKAAVKMKGVNAQTEIRCYKGYAHAELACFNSAKWMEEVTDFITKKN